MDYRYCRVGRWVRFVGPGANKGRVGDIVCAVRGTARVVFLGDDRFPGTDCFPHHLTSVTRREREVAIAASLLGIKEAPPCIGTKSASASGADTGDATTSP